MKRFPMFIAAASFLAALAIGGVGHADCGPGGSPTNPAGSCETSSNQVHCAGTNTPAGSVSVSADGAELCRQDSGTLDGRAGASQECQCVYVDGDDDNNHTLLLHGWIRIDATGVHCRENEYPSPNPSYNSSPGTQTGHCGPV